jgi:hypothetical protein
MRQLALSANALQTVGLQLASATGLISATVGSAIWLTLVLRKRVSVAAKRSGFYDTMSCCSTLKSAHVVHQPDLRQLPASKRKNLMTKI